MGCTLRERHIRANRRSRSAKPQTQAPPQEIKSKSDFVPAVRKKPAAYQTPFPRVQFGNMYPNLKHDFDDSGWGYCTEEQLEEILLKNLDLLYTEAIKKLGSMGHDRDVALKALLRNGHCYGGMDVLTNILHNCLAYLNSNPDLDESEAIFSDLKQLQEYALACMVCLLQQVRPHLRRGDAMWCLLMSDLHVGRASEMEIPAAPFTANFSHNFNHNICPTNPHTYHPVNPLDNVLKNSVGVAPALCRFHSGWGFGNNGTSEHPMRGFVDYAPELNLQKEIECPERFNLSPTMRNLLKRNVAMFAAGFRANSKEMHAHSQAIRTPQNSKNEDVVNLLLNKFKDLNLDENIEYVAGDQKDEMILSLIHQMKDLERQVKDRKEWAHQKAMQAARKLSSDLTELKMLRMEREEIQRLKQGKPSNEDPTMKRLSEMEIALRKASSQVDRANAAVRRLENENAEIKAEMEASKLSASESVRTCLEIAKREKKCLKRLLVWEKQKGKLQEEIAAEKRKIFELEEQKRQVETDQKIFEAKCKQAQKAKDQALVQLEEERRLKEATESTSKRKDEALRLKIEIDNQRHKDDLQRLEQELSRLRMSTELNNHPNNSFFELSSNAAKPTIARLLHELDNLEDSSSDKEEFFGRECLICSKDQVSVVFLPCAHQVLCANCNDDYGKKGKAVCPCCRIPIEQRIRVFGASS